LITNITTQVEQIQQRIVNAAQRAGRNPQEITLVAVSKTYPIEAIRLAYQAGLRHFGENRMEEALQKMAAWVNEAEPLQWHFIGHLQRRQAESDLGQQFSLLHSVDSLKLAERLDRLSQRDNQPAVNILLECNVSGEASKFGFDLATWQQHPTQLNHFLREVRQIAALDKIVLKGLMTMAPYSDDPETARPIFHSLALLQKTLQAELPTVHWQQLSMGMTDDFEVAIEEGATLVRIGRAIFGERS